VDLGASETGNIVTEVLDESERALLWVAHRIGALPENIPSAPASAPDPGAADMDGDTGTS
jgi:hypothetical protein